MESKVCMGKIRRVRRMGVAKSATHGTGTKKTRSKINIIQTGSGDGSVASSVQRVTMG